MVLFTLQNISKYRTELMGFAILGVLVGHVIAFSKWNMPILDRIAHGIHTPGFLFLSGFGLFYSLSKNSKTIDFYKRRFWRFYLPFVLIVLPFLLRSLFTGNFYIWSFISQITTLNFWFYGNNNGMWYIAVSFALYVITPPIFHFITRNQNFVLTKFFLVIIGMIGINCGIKYISSNYWDMVEIGMKYTPMFFVGMLVAYVTKKGWGDGIVVAITTLLFGILYIVMEIGGIVVPYIGVICKTLFYTLVLCVFLSILAKMSFTYLSKVLAWFGKYTLELYVLHLFINSLIKSPLFNLDNTKSIIIACVLSIILCMPTQKVINSIIKRF